MKISCSAVLNKMNTGICLIDTDLNINYINHKAVCIFGEHSRNLIGKPYANLILPHFPENLRHPSKIPAIFSLNHKKDFNYTINVDNGNGLKFPVECIVSPLFDENQNMIGIVESYITGTSIKQKMQLMQLQKSMGKYISDTAMVYINSSVSNAQNDVLTAIKRYKTIAFIDIVGFTTLSEKYEPLIVISILNFFYQRIYDTIKEYEGDISKFIGDAMLLVFDNTEKAVRCVTDIILKDLPLINAQLKKKYGETIKIHVGLNSGWVIMGDLGAEYRKDYTVIGDNVNIASRIQSLTPPDEIWISGSCLSNLGKLSLLFDQIETMYVKGKKKPLALYKFQPQKLTMAKRVLIYEKSNDIREDIKFRLRRMGVKEITIVENEKQLEREAQVEFDNMLIGPSAGIEEIPKISNILKSMGKEKNIMIYAAEDVRQESIYRLEKMGIKVIVPYDKSENFENALKTTLQSSQIKKIKSKEKISDQEREKSDKKSQELENEKKDLSAYQIKKDNKMIVIDINKNFDAPKIEELVKQMENVWRYELKENKNIKFGFNFLSYKEGINENFLKSLVAQLFANKRINLASWPVESILINTKNTELKSKFFSLLKDQNEINSLDKEKVGA
ncbi:MAG: PAS domain-containing protein [Spirochaetia bacterium]|nr:PAS domain-containing protein [Spirochaetia bacterium]